MLYRAMFYSVAGVMLAITQAGAATYTYTGNVAGNSPSDDYYVSATVDVTCPGSCLGNTFADGTGLNSFTLSIDNASNDPIFTISSSDPGYTNDGAPDYLTLSNAGVVTNWQFILDNGSDITNIAIYTIGYDPSDGTQDLFAFGLAQSGTNGPNPGIWSGPGITGQVGATPLPSAWTMLIAGFLGLGFFAYRGSRKSAAALASA